MSRSSAIEIKVTAAVADAIAGMKSVGSAAAAMGRDIAEAGGAKAAAMGSSITSGMQRAQQSIAEAGAHVKEFGGRLQDTGAKMTMGVTLPIVAGFAAVMNAARESNAIGRVTEAIIKSTGGAAGLTGTQVGDMATRLSNLTGVDDELIQKNANLLLTFTGVKDAVGKGNDVFTQANALALDMGTVMGSSSAASVQLGKALNDPVKGITALSKAGVTFTEQQREQIKTLVQSGDTLSAQKIILGEVTKEFGGAAAAAADPWERFKVQVGNLAEKVGNAVIPVFLQLMPTFEKIVNVVAQAVDWFGRLSPTVQTVVLAVVGIIAALGPVIAIFGTITTVIGGAMTAFAAIGTVIGFIVSPIGLVVVAIAALVAGLAYAYTHFEGFREAVNRVAAAVGGVLRSGLEAGQAAIRWFVDTAKQLWAAWGDDIQRLAASAMRFVDREITPTLQAIKGYFTTFVNGVKSLWARWGDDITSVVTTVFGAISRIVSTVFDSIVPIVRGALNTINAVITAVMRAIRGDWSGAWEAIQRATSSAIDTVIAIVRGIVNVLGSLMSEAWALAKAAVSAGVKAVVGEAKALPGQVVAALGNVGSLLVGAGKELANGMISGIKSMAGAVASAAGDMASGAVAKVKGFLKIASPSKVFDELGQNVGEGFGGGITKSSKDAIEKARKMAEDAARAAQDAISATFGAANANKSLADAQSGVTNSSAELAAAMARQEELSALITAAEARLTAARAEAQEVTAREQVAIERATKALEEAKAKFEAGEISSAAYKVAQQDLTQAQTEATASTQDVSDAERELSGLKDEASQMSARLTRATQAVTTSQLTLIDAQIRAKEAHDTLTVSGGATTKMFDQLARSAGVSSDQLAILKASIDAIPTNKTVTITTVNQAVGGGGGGGPKAGAYARGGYFEPRPGGYLGVIAEAGEPEVVAPDAKLRQIVREESGGGGTAIDYERLGAVIANALRATPRDITINNNAPTADPVDVVARLRQVERLSPFGAMAAA